MSIFRIRYVCRFSRLAMLLALSVTLTPGIAQATPWLCDEDRVILARNPNPQTLRRAEPPMVVHTPRRSRSRRSNTDNPWESVPFNPDEFWDWLQQNAP